MNDGTFMNILLVSAGPCCPPTAGNRIRILNLMVRLARRHRITFICCATDPGEAAETRSCLGDHGIETILVTDPRPPKHGPLFYARLAANLLSSLPYSVRRYESAKLRQTIEEQASRRPIHLCQVEWFPYARDLRRLTGIPTVVVAHDVVSMLWQRHYNAERQPLKRWYIRQQWRKFERFEREVYADADRVVAVSPEDARILSERMGVAAVDVVDNGVDKDYFAAVSGQREPGRILFLGTLESRPNLDAVRQMLDRVFPAVLAQEPSARLCIVGRNPPDWLRRRVLDCNGVELHGSVADVRPFMGQSGVMAVPLRIGGGSRIKILEALSAGLPVVSTRIGVEGLSLTPGEHLDVVEDCTALAGALVKVIRNPERACHLAGQGRHVVRKRYDWDVLADKLEQSWQETLRRWVPGDKKSELTG